MKDPSTKNRPHFGFNVCQVKGSDGESFASEFRNQIPELSTEAKSSANKSQIELDKIQLLAREAHEMGRIETNMLGYCETVAGNDRSQVA